MISQCLISCNPVKFVESGTAPSFSILMPVSQMVDMVAVPDQTVNSSGSSAQVSVTSV